MKMSVCGFGGMGLRSAVDQASAAYYGSWALVAKYMSDHVRSLTPCLPDLLSRVEMGDSLSVRCLVDLQKSWSTLRDSLARGHQDPLYGDSGPLKQSLHPELAPVSVEHHIFKGQSTAQKGIDIGEARSLYNDLLNMESNACCSLSIKMRQSSW